MKKKKKEMKESQMSTVRGSGSADLTDWSAAETQPDSFVCSSDPRVARAGAKLDPRAFRSAGIGAAAHKSPIINLRKMSCVWQPWPASVKHRGPPEDEQ